MNNSSNLTLGDLSKIPMTGKCTVCKNKIIDGVWQDKESYCCNWSILIKIK